MFGQKRGQFRNPASPVWGAQNGANIPGDTCVCTAAQDISGAHPAGGARRPHRIGRGRKKRTEERSVSFVANRDIRPSGGQGLLLASHAAHAFAQRLQRGIERIGQQLELLAYSLELCVDSLHFLGSILAVTTSGLLELAR